MSQINVDNIRNRLGGAIGAPSGIVVTGVSTFSGDVSIGGTLTYEDVTNIDSVGVITARSGLVIGGDANNGVAEGFKLDANGLMQVSRGSGVSALFAGYTQGSSTQTSRINNNGNAYFLGNVGVGTNNPGQKLHVLGDGSTAVQVSDGTNNQYFASVATNNNFSNGSVAGDALIRGQSGFAVSPNNGSSVKFRIASDGSITAAGNLDLGDINNGSANRIYSTGYIFTRQDDTTQAGYRLYSGGFGADDVVVQLKADGKITATDATFSKASTNKVTVENTAGTGNAIIDVKIPSGTLEVGINPTANYFNSSNTNPYVWYTNGSEVLRVDSAGSLTAPGSVKIGGTAAANQIDEYEEGTWTPRMGSNTDATFDIQQGKYIRIGQYVTAWGYLRPTNFGTASAGDKQQLGNLPFTATGVPGAGQGGQMIWWDGSETSTTNNPTIAIDGSQNFGIIYGKTAADGQVGNGVAITFWKLNNRAGFQVTYIIN